MSTKLSDLRLKPFLLSELHQLGYYYASDMAHLTNVECLRIAGMGAEIGAR